MKKLLLVGAMLIGAASLAPNAGAVGCLSGAAVGGIGGHLAGHHAILGAGAGWLAGHMMAKHQQRMQQQQYQQRPAYGQYQQPQQYQNYQQQRTYNPYR